MKTKFFTLLSAAFLLGSVTAFAQNTGTGVSWDKLVPGSPIVLDENFQGFDLFHSDENPDQGNSSHAIDDDGITIIWGYQELEMQKPIINGGDATIGYSFYQCAFAPEWSTAYAFKNESENTTNVSDGFVEISRFDTIYSAIPQALGYFQVDLRNIDFVEMIQWTHSSTGGKRRGVVCEFSIDDAATWDTLRYQPGDKYSLSFTKDIFTGEKTSNSISCEPSGYGMTWADEIYESNIMLRFSMSEGQTPRIHDLKVYGDLPVSVGDVDEEIIKIYSVNKQIFLSESSQVEVYNLSGVMVKSVSNTQTVSMQQSPKGIYFVKATIGNAISTQKIIIN